MKDLISIVIPAYNIGDHLAGCLDSVLAQTYTNLEIVVVNDGSTDHTAQVMGTYAAKDSRVKAVHKENGGVTSARLRGMAEATGDWVGFVDGDDILEPTMYERLLGNAVKYHADISHCGYQMVFPDGRVDYYYNTDRVVEQDRPGGLYDLVTGEFVEPGVWNKLFSRSVCTRVLQNGVMDPTIRINEDLLMCYYMFREAERSVYEDICPYHYVLRKGSAATSKLNEHKLKDPLRVLDILERESAEMATVKAAVQARRAYQMINTATMPYYAQKALVAPYRREVRQRLRKELRLILHNECCSNRVKLMAIWAVVWPWSYGAVHRLHGILSGNAHKYDVE